MKYVDRFANIAEQEELIRKVHAAYLMLAKTDEKSREWWMEELRESISSLLNFNFKISCFEVV